MGTNMTKMKPGSHSLDRCGSCGRKSRRGKKGKALDMNREANEYSNGLGKVVPDYECNGSSEDKSDYEPFDGDLHPENPKADNKVYEKLRLRSVDGKERDSTQRAPLPMTSIPPCPAHPEADQATDHCSSCQQSVHTNATNPEQHEDTVSSTTSSCSYTSDQPVQRTPTVSLKENVSTQDISPTLVKKLTCVFFATYHQMDGSALLKVTASFLEVGVQSHLDELQESCQEMSMGKRVHKECHFLYESAGDLRVTVSNLMAGWQAAGNQNQEVIEMTVQYDKLFHGLVQFCNFHFETTTPGRPKVFSATFNIQQQRCEAKSTDFTLREPVSLWSPLLEEVPNRSSCPGRV